MRPEKSELCRMQEQCIRMLGELRRPAPAVRMKRAAKRLLGRAGAKETDPVFWPAGFLLAGIAESGRVLRDPAALGTAGEYLASWLKNGGRVRYADDAMAGIAAIRLWQLLSEEGAGLPGHGSSHAEAAAETARRVMAFLVQAPSDDAGSIIYHPSGGNRYIYADGTGMIAGFLAEYAAVCAEIAPEGMPAEQIFCMAGRQLENYISAGLDRRTGLPYHGYDLSPDGTAQRRGILGWGRATGFLMMGLSAYCVRTGDARMEECFRSLTGEVLSCLRLDGLFSWELPAAEGHVDTSGTAMIGIALKRWLTAKKDHGDDDLAQAAAEACDRITEGLLSRIRDGQLTDSQAECVDFGEHPQRYGIYPWGMGAGLWMLALMADDTEEGS